MICQSCALSRFLFALFVAAVLLGGCQAETPEPAPVTAGEAEPAWDALGVSFSADAALTAQAVAAEAERYAGQSVTVAGVVAEVCQTSGCWLTLAVDPDHAPIRVDVPRDTSGTYVYTFPMDISGRRVVVSGVLSAGDAAQHEHAEGGGHDEAESRALTLDLAIVANGALVERIGA